MSEAKPIDPGATGAPPAPEELEEWIRELEEDHMSSTAKVRVGMAKDALRRAYQRPEDYARCMELVDRHLRAAQEADKSWAKRTIKAMKEARDKGDKLTGRIGKLGRRPHVVEH